MSYSMGCLFCTKTTEMYPSQPRGPFCSDSCGRQYAERALKAVAVQRDRYKTSIRETLAILRSGTDNPVWIIGSKDGPTPEFIGAVNAADFAVARLERALDGKP